MPTPNHDPATKRVKQNPSPGVSPDERAKKGVEPPGSAREQSAEAQREAAAKPDKERSDWEGMTPKPEQGEDDIAAPGQLPETD